MEKKYIKIVGLRFDPLEGLTVVADANRLTMIEAAEFAEKQEDKDIIWLIVPCTCFVQ